MDQISLESVDYMLGYLVHFIDNLADQGSLMLCQEDSSMLTIAKVVNSSQRAACPMKNKVR